MNEMNELKLSGGVHNAMRAQTEQGPEKASSRK